MAVRLTLDVHPDSLEAAADILNSFGDRAPSSTRHGIYRIAEKLIEAAEAERQDFDEDCRHD